MTLSENKMAKWDDGNKTGHLYFDEDIKKCIQQFQEEVIHTINKMDYPQMAINKIAKDIFGKELCYTKSEQGEQK